MLVTVGAERWGDLLDLVDGDALDVGAVIKLPTGLRGEVASVGTVNKSAPGPNELRDVTVLTPEQARAIITFVVSQAGDLAQTAKTAFEVWLMSLAARRAHVWINGKLVDLRDARSVQDAVSDGLASEK